MGARLEDYEKAAPHKSFLHVDQFSGPEQLAKFLHRLDQDDKLYNEYFQVCLSTYLCNMVYIYVFWPLATRQMDKWT